MPQAWLAYVILGNGVQRPYQNAMLAFTNTASGWVCARCHGKMTVSPAKGNHLVGARKPIFTGKLAVFPAYDVLSIGGDS